MHQNRLVSIIIPVYNAESFLAKTIESALQQTWQNKEIIIVNDGSTDRSLQIANSFEGENIKIFSQVNKGASAARNTGLTKASGNFIQFLDADDLLSADKIALQVNVLQSAPNKVAVCSTVHFPDGKDHTEFRPDNYEDGFLNDIDDPVKFLIKLWGGYDNKGSMIQPGAWLIPAAIIKKAGQWNEELTLDDDGEFFCRVLLASSGVVKTQACFNYYRKHHINKSLSGKKTYKDLNSLLKSALLKKGVLLQQNNNQQARHAIYRQLYDVFIHTYPLYPQIYKIAYSELPNSNESYHPSLGGKVSNLLTSILGVKITLYLKYLLKKMTGHDRLNYILY